MSFTQIKNNTNLLLESNLSKNRNSIKANDYIIYSDDYNFMKFVVVELLFDEDAIVIKAISDDCNINIGETDILYLNNLQLGWRLNSLDFDY